MDWKLIVILCSLFLCIIVLLIKVFTLKKQINIFSKKIRERNIEDSHEMFKVITFDKDVLGLADALNEDDNKQKKIYAELIRDRDKMNYLVSGISHDFRTPLTASLGYLQLIEKTGKIDDPKCLEYLRIVKEKNDYLKTLSDDFFDLSKLSGKTLDETVLSEVDLSRETEEAMLQFYDRMNDKGLNVTMNIDKGIIIRSERLSVVRIIDNLLSNSVKYSASYIDVKLIGKKLIVTNDFDMKNDFDPKLIFEPYYQGGARGENGSGLGLYVVSRLCDTLSFSKECKKENNVFTIEVFFDDEKTVVNFNKGKEK